MGSSVIFGSDGKWDWENGRVVRADCAVRQGVIWGNQVGTKVGGQEIRAGIGRGEVEATGMARFGSFQSRMRNDGVGRARWRCWEGKGNSGEIQDGGGE